MKYLKNLLLASLLFSQFLDSNTLENFSENSKLLGVSLSPYGDTLTLIAENNFGEEVLYLIDANKSEKELSKSIFKSCSLNFGQGCKARN